MYCVVELNSKQYKIEPGKPVLVDNLDTGENEQVKIDRVLLVRDDKDGIQVGTPYVKGLSLSARVLGSAKGKKIRVFTYKRRKDYRRTIGSRPRYTRIVVDTIPQGA
jgi:large subunit ribosomal protein L21